MEWKKEYLDLILVPSGLLIMVGYHMFFLYKCRKHPQKTVIGYENHCKNTWVERMMQVDTKDRGLAVSVISTNISASNFLASTSLVLSSLIGAWVGNTSHNIFSNGLIYGDTRPAIISVKYISIISFFLMGFASFLQSVRNFVNASMLISMPNSEVPVAYVQKAVIKGGTFWSVGLRSLYFAFTLLMWIFGPIPMFLVSVIMVVILYFLDTNSTPLNPFQQDSGINPFRKRREEISMATWAIEHHERSDPNESGGMSTAAQVLNNE